MRLSPSKAQRTTPGQRGPALWAVLAIGLLVCGCSAGSAPTPQAHAGARSTSTASSTAPPPGAPTTTPPPEHQVISGQDLPAALGDTKPYWLLEKFTVSALLGAGLSQTMLEDYFNNPQTLLIIRPSDAGKVQMLPDATYVMTFHDYRQMQNLVSSGAIPNYVKLLLYDNEMWASTPVTQQRQPFTYEAAAETLAHEHGLGLIFTPAANLSLVLSPAYSNATKFDGYTNLGIASQSASHADVLEIQAQQDESNSGFGAFVSSAVNQAETANPRALVMVGLTTAPPHQVVTAQVLLNAYDTTRPFVSGYWLNVPGGPGGPQSPDVAVAFLQALAVRFGY